MLSKALRIQQEKEEKELTTLQDEVEKLQYSLEEKETEAISLKEKMSHPDLRGKPGCISFMRQKRTTHIMTKCIEINVTKIITKRKCLTKINDNK
jgi:phosphate uptake regulator